MLKNIIFFSKISNFKQLIIIPQSNFTKNNLKIKKHNVMKINFFFLDLFNF